MKPLTFALLSVTALIMLAAAGCDDGSGAGNPTPTPTPTPVPAACLAVPHAPNSDPDRPVITLNGLSVVNQALGTPYVDAGASAADPLDGDITTRIVVAGLDTLSTGTVGDYLVRYSVTDSRGSAATEAVRLVRVNSGTFAEQTKRDFGTSSAVMGYFEHLPAHYGDDPAQTFPVIVYNHGIGEDADFQQVDTDSYASSPDKLDLLLRRGLSGIINQGHWDDTRPFVVLSPQRCLSFDDSYVQNFVQYALNTYKIDPARVYMMGFSAGSFTTWEHLRLNPSQLAAAVTISGGGNTSPAAGCLMKDTPTWSFHAADDRTVPVADTINTVASIKACNPSLPHKLTIYPSGGHLIDVETLELTTLGQGEAQYDLFNQNLYDWMLQFTRPPGGPVVEAAAEAGVDSGATAPPSPLAVTLTVSPETIGFGRSATLTWNASGAESCLASGDWVGKQPAKGTQSFVPPAPGSYAYILSCSGPGGDAAQSVSLTVLPEDIRE
jgi:predicted esterase